jgi:fucose 4-O-acetylase-like acetyltransferase
MNRHFLSFFWNLRTLFVSCILYSTYSISQSGHPNSAICTRLTIDAAQLAHQSYLYCEDSYFSKNISMAEKNIDTAIFYMKESISVILPSY